MDRGVARQSLAAAGHVQPLDGPAFDALFNSFDPDRSNDLCLAEYVALSAFLQVGWGGVRARVCVWGGDCGGVGGRQGGRAAVPPLPLGGVRLSCSVCAASCQCAQRSERACPPLLISSIVCLRRGRRGRLRRLMHRGRAPFI